MDVKKIVITGAAGQIAYALIFRIGELFGFDQPISLHLLEIPEMHQMLEGIRMELEDCAFPFLKEIQIGSDPFQLFKDATHAFLVGAKPRGPGMERSQLLSENGKIFVEQGRALNAVASREVKVLVVGNPCNTNCLIALQNAHDLNKKNFHAMTRLDQNRAVFLLAKQAKVSSEKVSHLTIWGNHSSTQVPDFINAKINGKPACEVIQEPLWLESEFVKSIQRRGAEIIHFRGKSSAASAANAALDAMKAICFPTPPDVWYSSGVWSEENSYGIDQALVYSFPCRTHQNGSIEIIPGLNVNSFLKERLKITENELQGEKEVVCQMFYSK